MQKQFPLSVFAFIDSSVVYALQDAGGYENSRQNNLELHYYTYFTLVCLWCGRTVGRCTVIWLPNFLWWVDHYIFLPMVLRWSASRARAPLLCLESFSWFLFLWVIPVRFKGTVKRVKKKRVNSFATFLQHELNSGDVAGFYHPTNVNLSTLFVALDDKTQKQNFSSSPVWYTQCEVVFLTSECPLVYQEPINK